MKHILYLISLVLTSIVYNLIMTINMKKMLRNSLIIIGLSLVAIGCDSNTPNNIEDDVFPPVLRPSFPSEYHEPNTIKINGNVMEFNKYTEETLRSLACQPATEAFDAHVSGYGELKQVVGDHALSMDSLTVYGPINFSDLCFIKECVTMHRLRSVNLANTTVEGNQIPDYTFFEHSDVSPNEGTYPVYVPLFRLILPEGLNNIGTCAFAYTLLTEIKLPSTLKELGVASFIQNIFAQGDLSIPQGITNIPELCFCDIANVTTITVPGSVKTIDERAFFIETGKAKTRTVTLNNGIEVLAAGAFGNNSFKQLVLPASIRDIGAGSLGYKHVELYALSTNPPTVDSAFYYNLGNTGIQRIYIPVGSKDKYLGADGWKDFPAYKYVETNNMPVN